MSEYKPKIVSLFSGAGGFDLGFKMEGYETIFANDFNKFACESFNYNIENVCVCDSVYNIDFKKIKDCDLIIGGFPCQAFSIAGLKKGFEDERGVLFYEYCRALKELQPKAFVAENVVGLLYHNKGKTINEIIKSFEDCGYFVKINLVDFSEYGVPQRRKRVIFVGVRLDTGFNYVFPKPTHGDSDGLIPFITAKDILNRDDIGELIPIRTKMQPIVPQIKQGEKGIKYTKCGQLELKRLKEDRPCYTVCCERSGLNLHYSQDRLLTIKEISRIQTFPEDFKFSGGLKQQLRQIGNAVPPEGIRPFARQLKNLFLNQYDKVNIEQIKNFFYRLSPAEREKLSKKESFNNQCFNEFLF